MKAIRCHDVGGSEVLRHEDAEQPVFPVTLPHVAPAELAGDDTREVRTAGDFVRADADRLARLVALIDSGELAIDIAQRVPLSELLAIHAQAARELHGEVVATPDANQFDRASRKEVDKNVDHVRSRSH